MKMSFLSLLISHNINSISNLNSISDYILKVSEKKKTITAHKTERFNILSYRWQRLQNLLGVEATAWRCALVHCILWGFSVWFHAIPFNSLCTGVEFCVEDVQVSLLPCLKKTRLKNDSKCIRCKYEWGLSVSILLCLLASGCQVCNLSLSLSLVVTDISAEHLHSLTTLKAAFIWSKILWDITM